MTSSRSAFPHPNAPKSEISAILGHTMPSFHGSPQWTVACITSASFPCLSYFLVPFNMSSARLGSSKAKAESCIESNLKVFCQFVKVVTVINPCSIPPLTIVGGTFPTAKEEAGTVWPSAFCFASSRFAVRTKNPKIGSSTSILSAMYSRLSGLDVFLTRFPFLDLFWDNFFACLRIASLQSSTISAICSLKGSLSVTSCSTEPPRSLAHCGTSRKE
mmetsp:Transcript_50492/g.152080  ORF Transcript_50492/g.152080 Transcript_50492/m.152080 type:complete len:217 (-) Transcript_50492:330-980(-)